MPKTYQDFLDAEIAKRGINRDAFYRTANNPSYLQKIQAGQLPLVASPTFDPEAVSDSAWADFGKGLYNGSVVETAQDIANIVPILTKAGAGGDTPTWINTWQNNVDDFAKSASMEYSPAGQKSFFDDYSINALASAAGQGIGSVISYVALAAATGGVGDVLKAASTGSKAVGAVSKLSQATQAITGGSVLMINQSYRAGKEAGLSDTDAARLSIPLGVALSATELVGGVEAKFLLGKAAGKGAIRSAVKASVGQWAGKELPQGAFGAIIKNTTTTVGKSLRKLATEGLKQGASEAGEEAAQAYLQAGFEDFYDSFYAGTAKVGQGKFGTDVTSPEAAKGAAEQAFYGGIIGAFFGAASHMTKGGVPTGGNDLLEQGLFGYINASARAGQPENIIKIKDSITKMVDDGSLTQEQGQAYIANVDRVTKRNESIWQGITNSPARFQAFQLLELKDELASKLGQLNQQISTTDDAFKKQTAALPGMYDEALQQLNKTIGTIGETNKVVDVVGQKGLVDTLRAINSHPATTDKIDTSRLQDAIDFHKEITTTTEEAPEEQPIEPIPSEQSVSKTETPTTIAGKKIGIKWKPRAELERIGTKLFNNEPLTPEEKSTHDNQPRAVEAVLKKKTRDKIFARVPETPEEVILQFFASGNRISKKDIGLFINQKDLNKYIWAWSNKGQAVDQFEELFPPNLSADVKGMGYQGLSNLIGEVLRSHSGRASMFQRLVDLHKMEEPTHQVAPIDSITKDYTERDSILAELSENEMELMSDNNVDEGIIFDGVDQLTDKEVQEWFDILDRWEKKKITEQDLNDYKTYIYGEYTQNPSGEAAGGQEILAQTPVGGPQEKTPKKVEDATQERKKQEGNQPEHLGTTSEREKTQPGGSNRPVGGVREGEEIQKEAEINSRFSAIANRYPKDVTVREAINPVPTESGIHPEYTVLAKELGYISKSGEGQENYLKNSINKSRREEGLPPYIKMGDIPISELIARSKDRAVTKREEIASKRATIEATKEQIVTGYKEAKAERATQLHKSTKVENIKAVYDKVIADVALYGEGKLTLQEATTVGGEPFLEWFRKKHTPGKKTGLRSEEYRSMRAAYELAVSKAKEAIANKGTIGNQKDVVFLKYGVPRKAFALISQKPSVYNAIVKILTELYPDIIINTAAELPKGIVGRAYNDSVRRVVEWSSQGGRLDTAPHEYAHHYIDMFRNTALVQEGIAKYGEEELVQAMGEAFATRAQLSPVQRFAAKIWAFIRSVFGSTDIMMKLSDAFFRGESLGAAIGTEANQEFEAFQREERFNPYESAKKYRESIWNSLLNGVDSEGNRVHAGIIDEVDQNITGLQKLAEKYKIVKLAVDYINGSANLPSFLRATGGKFGELYNSIGLPFELADLDKKSLINSAFDTVKDSFSGNEKKTSWLSGQDVNKVKIMVTQDEQAQQIEVGEGQMITTYLAIKQDRADDGFISESGTFTLTAEQANDIVKAIESDKSTMTMVAKAQEAINIIGERADTTYAKFGGHGGFVKDSFPLRYGEKQEGGLYGREQRTMGDMRIENTGSGPVRIDDFGEIFENYVQSNAAYSAYAVPVQTAREFIRRTAHKRSESKVWVDLHKFLAKQVTDIEDPTFTMTPEGRWIQKAKNMIARSWLALNPWTGFKQLPGLYVSAAVINGKYLLKAAPEMINTWGKGFWKWKVSPDLNEDTKRYTANSVLFRSRIGESANRITGEDTGKPWDSVMNPLNGQEYMTTFRILGKEVRIPNFLSSTRWLEHLKVADIATFTTIAKAVEYEMADTHPNIAKDSPEYWKVFNDRFNFIVWRTQPMYDPVHRSAFARSTNPIMQVLTMFSSQQQVNFNLMMESIVDYSRNQTPENRIKMVRTFGTAIVLNALMVATIDTGRSILYGYDDDDNDKVMDVTLNTISGSMGTMFGIREITDAALANIRGKAWQGGAQHPVLDIIDQVGSLIGDAVQGKGTKSLDKATKIIIQWNGLPLSFYTTGRVFYKKGTAK